MLCALCLEDARLKKSHIIPEFMFSYLYDDIHRFHSISLDPDEPNSLLQKGLRERLLCEKCEKAFSKHERYVSLLFNGGLNLEVKNHNGLLVVRGVNYEAFRFFQLSVLWRASVSTLPFFSQLNLGHHQDRLRTLLLSQTLPESWRYGCLLSALIHDGKPQTSLIVQPTWTRINNIYGYRFTFGGFVWVYFVSNHPSTNHTETLSLTPSGELRILKGELKSAEFITNFAQEIAKYGKL